MPSRRLDPTRWPALQSAAEAAGVSCLESDWLGHDRAHRFRCQQCGAEWLRAGTKAIHRAACPECACEAVWGRQRRPEHLARLQALAEARGGACLSTHYTTISQTFAFRCHAGHEWLTRAQSIYTGSWCPRCDALRKSAKLLQPDGLQRLQQLAQSRGGECLSGQYLGTAARYSFRCGQGHEWQTTGAKLVRGVWCRPCHDQSRQLGLPVAQAIAKARGGLCLAERYINVNERMPWRCQRGHDWLAPLANVKSGHWCRRCADLARISNPHGAARRRARAEGL
jgi:phage FluMu protein Com